MGALSPEAASDVRQECQLASVVLTVMRPAQRDDAVGVVASAGETRHEMRRIDRRPPVHDAVQPGDLLARGAGRRHQRGWDESGPRQRPRFTALRPVPRPLLNRRTPARSHACSRPAADQPPAAQGRGENVHPSASYAHPAAASMDDRDRRPPRPAAISRSPGFGTCRDCRRCRVPNASGAPTGSLFCGAAVLVPSKTDLAGSLRALDRRLVRRRTRDPSAVTSEMR